MLNSLPHPRHILSFFVACCALFMIGIPYANATVEDHDLILHAGTIVTKRLTDSATGIGFTLEKPGKLHVQFLEEEEWSEWNTLSIDPDAQGMFSTAMLIADDATAVRIKSDTSMKATLHSITVSDAPLNNAVASARSLATSVVIPRWQWANESLTFAKGAPRKVDRTESFDQVGPDRVQYCSVRSRLYPDEFLEVGRKFYNEDGIPLRWPQGHSKDVRMFIIHHTASPISNTKKSGLDMMRATYQYHAISRKWGDIGYNFVIDPDGKIYEGRAGGPKVVGAHAYCNNVGTIGISLMGNFQNERPTDGQLQALRILIASLSKEHNIDPNGRVVHHGKLLPTVVVHREVGQTACAGQYLNELLPQIRDAVKNQDYVRPIFSTNARVSTKAEAALIDYPESVTLKAGERKTFTVKFMNMGLDTWTQKTWLLGEGDDVFFTQYLPFSYVAGFLKEQKVQPGEVGTFEVSVQANVDVRGGKRSIRLTPVINNERRMVRNVASIPANLLAGNARFTYVTSYFPSLHLSGEDLTGVLKIVNSGAVPWEKDTITGIDFVLEGGVGEISILESPERVDPGKQAAFKIRLLNVNEEGKYERKIVPKLVGGSTIQGTSILIASRAEPIPAIFSPIDGAADLLAQSRRAYSRGRATTYEGATLETTIGTSLTLIPKEQAVIPVRIRAGEKGISKNQIIADVESSSNTVVLRDENNRRIRNVFRSPLGLQRYKTWLMEMNLRAPSREGKYTFSIGDITFNLTVRKHARDKSKAVVQQIIADRAKTRRAERSRSLIRQQRKAKNTPVLPSDNKQQKIRIRLSYETLKAKIDANAPLLLQGESGIISTSGLIHISKDRDFCSVITTDGRMTDKIVRIWARDINGLIKISSMDSAKNIFRGVIECRVINGKMIFINELPIEEYLMGLAEEPDSQPWEKQRAFAIAARTYALYYTLGDQKKFPGKPYDGSDSPREFQLYGGAYFEQHNPRWVEAVKNTAGKVLTYQRQIIKPPYHSSNDGRTRSAFEVWGWKHTPYLISVPDNGCVGNGNAGHLVGMSGCGTKAKALAGETAEQMLQYYYPGTRLLPYDYESMRGLHTK